jgi:hypothetical protein
MLPTTGCRAARGPRGDLSHRWGPVTPRGPARSDTPRTLQPDLPPRTSWCQVAPAPGPWIRPEVAGSCASIRARRVWGPWETASATVRGSSHRRTAQEERAWLPIAGASSCSAAGRTSTETLRRTSRLASGEHKVLAEEFAVLDRAGRLQLPRAHVEALGLERRVRLRLESDHIGIWPDGGHELPGESRHGATGPAIAPSRLSGPPAAPSSSPGRPDAPRPGPDPDERYRPPRDRG